MKQKSINIAGATLWLSPTVPTHVINAGIGLYFVGQIATALADAYVIDPIVDWLAESPSNSFVAGTGVVTGEDEDGNLITTNIEDLEIGDLVLARDEFDPNAPNRYSIVTAVSHRTVYEQTTVTYIDESGNTEVIESTGNHEYYIDGLGWVTAELLTAGQEVVLPDGRAATIASVVSTEIPEGVEVYNLTVADGATYFVDDGEGEVRTAWVHNTRVNLKSAIALFRKSDKIINNASSKVTKNVRALVRVGNKGFLDFNPAMRNVIAGNRHNVSALNLKQANAILRKVTGNKKANILIGDQKGLATGVHAEIGAILEAAETLGGLKGKHVLIVVNGTTENCSECLKRIPHVLKQLGVASFELRDLVAKARTLKTF